MPDEIPSNPSTPDSMTTGESSSAAATPPRWKPLTAIQRRVAGVLVEKAKTTPEAYPMSVNAICTGCNQKSNRAPTMELEPDRVEEALEQLRGLGAVGLIEGSGRVTKYRHYLYEWLGVDKVELAVMAELLLRGDQTEGELRGRAARMEPIRDLAALRPVLDSLRAKALIVSLTPEGRGHVVTHALYQPQEMERLKAQYAGGRAARPEEPAAAAPLRAATTEDDRGVEELRAQLGSLRAEVEELSATVAGLQDEVRRLREAVGS